MLKAKNVAMNDRGSYSRRQRLTSDYEQSDTCEDNSHNSKYKDCLGILAETPKN